MQGRGPRAFFSISLSHVSEVLFFFNQFDLFAFMQQLFMLLSVYLILLQEHRVTVQLSPKPWEGRRVLSESCFVKPLVARKNKVPVFL